MQEVIESIIQPDDQYVVGLGDLAGLLNNRYSGYNHAIVIGKRLDDRIIDSIESGPNLRYFVHYNEINLHLLELQKRVSKKLEELGVPNVIVEPTTHDEDLDENYFKTLRYDFSHKMAATRAGLGWIGKTDLFISLKFGPRLRLATVLIDFPVKSLTPPIDESRCGDCLRCVESCPAGAANGRLWDVRTDRDEFYDAFKCRAYARKVSAEKIGKEVSLCGICVSVCPWGKRTDCHSRV